MAHGVKARVDYIGAALAMAILAWTALSGGTAAALIASNHGRPVPPPMPILFTYIPGTLALIGIALFIYLAVRPHWLGKVFCVWAGTSWIGFAVVAIKMDASSVGTLSIGAAGLLMLACALVRWTVTLPVGGQRA